MIDMDMDKIIPVSFYPYAHCVTDKILRVEYNSPSWLHDLHLDLCEHFDKCGVLAHYDNKTVFEVELKYNRGQSIFIGFYDWFFSIGFNCKERL